MRKHLLQVSFFVAALGSVWDASASALSAPPRTRRFPRVLYLVEMPLSTTYSNGNTWTGWTGRWVDWPLMVDRSVTYSVGDYYSVTWPDLERTFLEMREGGLDGAIFNVSRRRLSGILAKAIAGGKRIPVLTVPDYPPIPRRDGYRAPPEIEDEPWFASGFFNANGYFFEGKPLVTSYSMFSASEGDVKRRCSHIREKYGDFHFVPDISIQSVSRWKAKIRKGQLGEADFEELRERMRRILRISDGLKYANYTDATDVFGGERSFDADFFRRYLKPLILQVFAEPEFKDKLLSMNVGMGHMNTYSGFQRCSSNGTKTLRDSFACALELNPDFITFFEWDEWNENTGIRPTLWNSFAARRIVCAMRSEAEGRTNEPLPGDDLAIPNIIVSFRKTLALGDSFCVELLSVPDSAAKGNATVKLTLKDENGTALATFPRQRLDLTRMDERRIRWDSALAGDSCVIIPELEVEWPGGHRIWKDGLPFAEVRTTANWDRKWVLMPLRDLLDGASCAVSACGSRDGVLKIGIKAKTPRPMDRLEVLDGGDIVYSMSGDERNSFREDDGYYVFASMNFCSVYTSGNGELSVEGVTDAEWLIGMQRTRGLKRKIHTQAKYTPDTYLRIRKDEAPNAVLKLRWGSMGEYSVPLDKVLANGVYSVSGTNGLCFGVHRFNRQAAFFTPVAAKHAESVADIVPDLPVSVISGHALTSDGKIFRSRPIVVGKRSGRKVSVKVWSEERGAPVDVIVDSARVPDLAYDVSGEKSGTVARSGYGWAFNGILGGSTAVGTRRNRGGDSRQHCCTEKSAGLPSRAPAVSGSGLDAEMEFDGTGRYFVMPGGTIPTTCAYRFSFEFLPEVTGGEQEIFACGSPSMWGVIGFLKIARDGRVRGVCLSAHHRGDAYFTSRNAVKFREWNRIEVVSHVDSIELFLNGESSGRVSLLQPGRFNSNCWFGGREKALFKGRIRNVRVAHGRDM
jgi:hypothetical protein